MKQIRRLILATDFSEDARRAYPFAVRLVEPFNGKIFLVHFRNGQPPEYSGKSSEQHIREIFQKLVDESRRDEFARVSIGFKRLDRNVGKSLPAFEEQIGADLLITAIRRHKGLDYFMLSDIGEEVIVESTIPVLVYAGPLGAERVSEPKRVLVPVAHAAGVGEMLRAARFWSHQGCKVYILLVSPQSDESRSWFRRDVQPITVVRQSVESEVERLAESELQGVAVQLICRAGVPAKVIGEFADSNEIDLILIGGDGFKKGIGKQLVNRAHCSVMLHVSESTNEL